MNVPQLRFDGFDGEWQELCLGEHVEFKNGLNYLKSDRGESVYTVGVKNFNQKKLKSPIELEKINLSSIPNKDFLLKKDDLLFVRSNGNKELVGRMMLIENELTNTYYSGFVIRGRIKEQGVLEPLFLLSLESKIKGAMKTLTGGTNISNLSQSILNSLVLNVPSIREQQKIASFLTLIEQKIEKQQEKIEKLEQFKKGMMQKIFSQELRFKDEDGGEFPEWETKSLMELGEFKRSYSFSRSYEGEGKYFHIHYGDIHTKLRSIIDTDTELPNINVNGDLEELEAGDILFADASEDYKDLGKAVVIISNENKKIVAGLHTHRFRPSSLINPVYLMYFTKTDYYSSFIRMYGTGVSVLGISKTNLGIIDVPIPSVKEQEKIADYLLSIEKKVKKEKEKLLVLEEQKKGFMQGMFV